MDINNDTSQNYNYDSNDEDNDYFLQSTACAYDIQEKIRAANDELFEDFESSNTSREQKVTFREELVDYEPDYYSDDGYVQSPDVLSIISDNENESNHEDVHHEIIYAISEEENDLVNTENCEILELCETKNNSFFETIDDTNEPIDLIEDIDNNCIDEEILEKSDNEIEEEIYDEQYVEVVEIVNDSFEDDNESYKKSTDSTDNSKFENSKSNEKPTKKLSKKLEPVSINCRIHCLEKKELDLITSKTKKFVDELKGPVLKLRQRACCTNQDLKPKLPIYNGFVSEYGLTKSQLERRQLRNEKNAQRKKTYGMKIKEEKKLKDLYNEEIFCAWLEAVKSRNQTNQIKNNNKEYKTIETSPVEIQTKRQRPKTANIYQAYPSTIKKIVRKRPSTSLCKTYTYDIIITT